MEEKTVKKNEDKKTLKLPIWLVILIGFLGGLFLLYASMALIAKMNYNRRIRNIRMPIKEHNEMMLKKNKRNYEKAIKNRMDNFLNESYTEFLRKNQGSRKYSDMI